MKMKRQILISLILTSSILTIKAQQIPVSGNEYHYYGPNTTWGQYLQVGGNGRVTTNASVATSNGNLHLDSKDGFGLYLNYYSLGNTYINPNGGYVGIGTTTIGTQTMLHIKENGSSIGIWKGRIVASGDLNAVVMGERNGKAWIGAHNAELNAWSNLIMQAEGGNIGIGMDNPTSKLVLSDEYGTMSFTSMGIGFNRNVKDGLIFNSSKSAWQFTSRDERFTLEGYNGPNHDLLTVLRNGNIGIGTITPQYTLDVIGTIRAREIKVDLNGADFVFEKDYKLMPLTELEKFVKEQKHLPEVAPAKEMKENGTDLGDLNSKLLQKMEEMTLYIIEQNKELQVLKEKIAKLESASK